MAWIVNSIIKLKAFITTSLKYSSVAIVIVIPLAILLNSIGLVRNQVIVIISEIVIYFAIGEALTNAILKKIKKEKIEFAEIKIKIEQKRFEELEQYKKDDVQFSDILIEKVSELIKSIVNKDKTDSELQEDAKEILEEIISETSIPEETLETSIPGHEVSVR